MNKKQMLSVFKKSVKSLLKQGKQSWSDATSVNGNSGYKYNGPGGLHCSIGFLIKPEFYKKSLEARSVEEIIVRNALIKSGIKIETQTDIDFLAQLQETHDYYEQNWISEFKNIARDERYLGLTSREASKLVESLRPKSGTFAKK